MTHFCDQRQEERARAGWGGVGPVPGGEPAPTTTSAADNALRDPPARPACSPAALNPHPLHTHTPLMLTWRKESVCAMAAM